MSNTKKMLIKSLIVTGIGVVAFLVVMWLRDFFAQESLAEKYRILADAACIPGAVLVSAAGIVWVSMDGLFDMLGYAMSRVGGTLIPGAKMNSDTFYDYKVKKVEKRADKDKTTLFTFLFVGIGFLLISVVFTVLNQVA